MEHTISTPFPQPEAQDRRRFGFFNVVSDPRTYGALLYMLLSMATGIFYFTWALVGTILSLVFSIFIIGIPFTLIFIASVRVLSHVEGRIVEALLGVRMPRRLPAGPTADEGIWAKVKEAFSDVRTWSSLFYMLLMLPLGITYFVIGVVGLSASLGVTAGAIYSLISGESHIQISDAPYLQHFLHTAPGLMVLALCGVLLFFIVLHVARAIGWVHGKIAEGLLVRL
jgi:ABC-type multidrug transport system fused ATPase/permease subunit